MAQMAAMAEMAQIATSRTGAGTDTGTGTRARTRTGTGGPSDKNKMVEQVVGWALVVVLAMLVTQLGLA
ncbi:SCO1431 family membrane protein [Streptomyces sp. NPDC057654]|uniref:SCO1431 family membrane protein n=1 Tax=Streptomyces sp. NPDC057654 TaxID=3346196 RepID=UPI00368C4CBC